MENQRNKTKTIMYIIIGGDGKEYGPISGEDLRKWIGEGRLSAQSQVKAESDAEFRPLATFPEFASAFAPAAAAPGAPPSFPSGGEHETAAHAVKVPAIALIVVASLGIAYYVFNCLFVFFASGTSLQPQLPPNLPPAMQSFMEDARGPLAGVVSLVIAALDGFVLFGAIKMLRFQNYGLAVAAAVVAMLPCQCCCLFGLPFGIWALVVMNRPEVKSLFRRP